jgi:hypothetical protein
MIGPTFSIRPLVAESTFDATTSRSALKRRTASWAFGVRWNQSRI